MKKSELKKILKPLVSECIKESLMEDGLISGVIAEVVRGMSAPVKAAPVPPTEDEVATERMQRNAFSPPQTDTLKEHRQKLMSAIGGESYNGVNLFEGTTPAPGQAAAQTQSSPLANQNPTDPGVDISNLFGAVGRNWNAHMTEMKERK
tara:strand:- start:262 stop:708 length:447 start_codon:yes stop_codon:yes gene_type:complete